MTRKTCRTCHLEKSEEQDFYLCAGKVRSECKACTITRNVAYQRANRSWEYRYQDEEERRLYMRDYYQRNKEKFAAYRARFRAAHPEYYKKYFREKKE